MSGIHKSKEVYKYTETPTGRNLVPVRGVYVSGLHTEPWYIDHTVSVTKYTSNDPIVVDYYETSHSATFGGLHFVGVKSYKPTINQYAIQRRNDTFAGLHFVGVKSYKLSLYKYQTLRTDSTFGGLHFVGVHDAGSIKCVRYSKKSVDSSREHLITVTKFESSNPTIENTDQTN